MKLGWSIIFLKKKRWWKGLIVLGGSRMTFKLLLAAAIEKASMVE
jgi:hypothetical protein